MIRHLKELLRRLLLKGPLLTWWISRRARQWERAYCAELVQSILEPVPSPAPGPISAPGALKRILFIADCMWEMRDLVPELRKIADVSVLDLRPELAGMSGSRYLPEEVASAVGGLARKNGPEPDVIFFYARPMLLSEEVFHCLRKRWHCPLLGMNVDDKFEFFPYGIFSPPDDDYQRWARQFDLNITNTLAATDWYRGRGLRCIYSPQGVHQTEDLTLPSSSDYRHDFGFLGSMKPERKFVVDELMRAGISIQLFGQGWPHSKWIDNPNALYRSTQINLGIGFATPSLSLTTVKNRDFECPGAGACYLTTYNWELGLHYEIGKEILCYRAVEELIEIFSFYRKRPTECLKIAQAAWRRCTNDHTWEKRFRRVFQEMGFRV